MNVWELSAHSEQPDTPSAMGALAAGIDPLSAHRSGVCLDFDELRVKFNMRAQTVPNSIGSRRRLGTRSVRPSKQFWLSTNENEPGGSEAGAAS